MARSFSAVSSFISSTRAETVSDISRRWGSQRETGTIQAKLLTVKNGFNAAVRGPLLASISLVIDSLVRENPKYGRLYISWTSIR